MRADGSEIAVGGCAKTGAAIMMRRISASYNAFICMGIPFGRGLLPFEFT
jgi:hypothetical protein